MLSRTRSLSITVLLATLLVILAACGGGAATPEERVKAFFTDYNTALADANLKDAAKQEEWADKISKHFQPGEQAKQKTNMAELLAGIGGNSGMKVSVEGLTTEKISEESDSAAVKITGGKMKMTMGSETREEELATMGFGGGGDTIKLKKIDGVWYINLDQ
jgi:hypothetical protein